MYNFFGEGGEMALNWYYADGGERKGPVDEEQIKSLLRDGIVRPDTLVWSEKMGDWAKASESELAKFGFAEEAAPSKDPLKIVEQAPCEAGRCALCGNGFPPADLVEINEAFAGSTLAAIRELDLDPARVNVNGGAIALGHPLGCTGAKLTTQLIYEMKRRDVQFGMVTMCIGGGMGAAGIFENLN